MVVRTIAVWSIALDERLTEIVPRDVDVLTGSRRHNELATFTHRTADFGGVPAALLRDAPLISGLVVAAAGAAGLSAATAPAVRGLGADGVSAILTLEAEGGHVAVHTFPDKKLLLLDILAPNARETEKAIDVFVRRLGATSVKKDEVVRG